MPFTRPSLTALRNSAIEDITTSGIPGLTGLLRAAVLRVLAWCMAGLAYSVYGYADWIARMGVPFTAQDEYLYAWAALIGVYPIPANPASGSVQFTGTAGTIPAGTELRRVDATPFTTTADGTIDATGTVTVPVVAEVDGAYTNTDDGTGMNIVAPIAGINSGGVTVGPLVGGADVEGQDALRTRMLFKYRQPPAGGSSNDYILWALEVPGCTRAWTLPGGYGPGSVVVYPMFDIVNAAFGGFPQGTNGCATEETRGPTASGDQLLVADHIWTVQPVTALVFVQSPAIYRIDVTLAALDPNTEEIRGLIVEALEDLLLTVGVVGGIIYPSDLYEAVLATPGVNHFTMTVPLYPIDLPQGYLPLMGTLTVAS